MMTKQLAMMSDIEKIELGATVDAKLNNLSPILSPKKSKIPTMTVPMPARSFSVIENLRMSKTRAVWGYNMSCVRSLPSPELGARAPDGF
jgi:hypothetical protein